jgi:hypothetical protein
VFAVARVHSLEEVEAALDIQFDEDPREVCFDGVDADAQAGGNLFVCLASHTGVDYLTLTIAELNRAAHCDFLG